MKNQSVEHAIRRILFRRGYSAPGMCPDENEFAAYLEARLTPAERARFEEHTCDCRACRRTLALALTLADEEPSAVVPGAFPPKRPFFSYLRFRLAMGAVFALIVGVLLFQATRNSGLFSPPPKVVGIPAQSGFSGGTGAELRSREAEKEAVVPARESQLARSKDSRAPQSADRRAAVNPAKPQTVAPAAPPAEPALPELVKPQAAARAEVAKGAVTEPREELLKARQVQTDASVLKMAAANLDEKKMPAVIGRRQDANQQRNEAVQAAIMQTGAEVQQAQPAKITGAGPVQQALTEVRQSSYKDAAADAKAKSESVKKIGSRIFYRTTSYWVDAECAKHDDAPQREITRDSKAYADMLVQEPALAELPADAPVLIFWNGAIFLVRPGTIKL